MNTIWRSATEQVLTTCLERFQKRAAAMWLGREKEAIFALTRVLDCAAVSHHWRETGEYLPVNTEPELNHTMFMMGCASALRPFLSVTKGQAVAYHMGRAIQVQPVSHTPIWMFAADLHFCYEWHLLNAMGWPLPSSSILHTSE